MFVGNGLDRCCFLDFWAYFKRICRCAIPNRATLPERSGEGELSSVCCRIRDISCGFRLRWAPAVATLPPTSDFGETSWRGKLRQIESMRFPLCVLGVETKRPSPCP